MTEGFEALLQRVRAGDQSAAAELVRTYRPALMRVIRVRLANPRLRQLHGESDVFQSVMGSFFVRAALGQYDLRTPEDLARLLAVMVRNKVAEKARRRDVVRDAEPLDEPASAPAAPDPGPSPSRVVAMRELAAQARSRLSPELMAIVLLRDEQLGWNEIAERVGGSPDALRKRLTRAVDDIATALGVEDPHG
ncbi:MAG: hypothetical protein IT379_38840 [Deltaproteobacteria bacterium]|nr:hypothetical protein [Deltaproteobacteria bacterium]